MLTVLHISFLILLRIAINICVSKHFGEKRQSESTEKNVWSGPVPGRIKFRAGLTFQKIKFIWAQLNLQTKIKTGQSSMKEIFTELGLWYRPGL